LPDEKVVRTAKPLKSFPTKKFINVSIKSIAFENIQIKSLFFVQINPWKKCIIL